MNKFIKKYKIKCNYAHTSNTQNNFYCDHKIFYQPFIVREICWMYMQHRECAESAMNYYFYSETYFSNLKIRFFFVCNAWELYGSEKRVEKNAKLGVWEMPATLYISQSKEHTSKSFTMLIYLFFLFIIFIFGHFIVAVVNMEIFISLSLTHHNFYLLFFILNSFCNTHNWKYIQALVYSWYLLTVVEFFSSEKRIFIWMREKIIVYTLEQQQGKKYSRSLWEQYTAIYVSMWYADLTLLSQTPTKCPPPLFSSSIKWTKIFFACLLKFEIYSGKLVKLSLEVGCLKFAYKFKN